MDDDPAVLEGWPNMRSLPVGVIKQTLRMVELRELIALGHTDKWAVKLLQDKQIWPTAVDFSGHQYDGMSARSWEKLFRRLFQTLKVMVKSLMVTRVAASLLLPKFLSDFFYFIQDSREFFSHQTLRFSLCVRIQEDPSFAQCSLQSV